MDGTRSLVSNGEIILYGIIDPMMFFMEDSIRAIDVIDSLAEIPGGQPVTVRINSPGGSLVEGVAIYNALKASGRKIIIRVDAIAASAASVVAMAGDEIIMAEGATMMIHDPYAFVTGTAEELRASADVVEMQREQMIDIYAARTGRSRDEVRAWMAAETYMTADEAVERGFATSVDAPMAIAACALLNPQDLARLLNAPASITVRAESLKPAAPAAPEVKGQDMSKENPNPAGVVQASAADQTALRNEGARLERERVTGISAAVRAAKLDQSFAEEMIADGTTVDQARAKIIDKWAEQDEKKEGDGTTVDVQNRIRIEADAVDRWAQGAQQGLMARAGLLKGDEIRAAAGNEFTGLTLAELARSALNVRNIKSGHMDRMTMVGTAFTVRASGPGYHSTSDFGTILGSVAHKAMMKGYEEVEETFHLWTERGTASDFRPIARVDVGLFPALDKVEEGAEYKYGTIGDTGTSVQIATYGKMFAITRQAIINDDMSFMTKVPQRMGRAAKRTIGTLVYAILTGNPTMQDGVALFHANHGNLAGSGAAPSVTALSAARTAMARQRDPDNISVGINVAPKFILLPPELVDATTVILNSQFIPGDAAQVPNPVRNLAQPISDARLTGAAWYLAADPATTDTIEVTYLDGNDTPFMDQRDGWTVDGTEYKVRIDAGVKALHWRGLYKNAGA